MKAVLTSLLAFSVAASAWSQSIPLQELVGPNNALRDSMYGVSVTYPAGWEVRGASRWGKNNQENTIVFQPLWPMQAGPSLYYQPKTNFDAPRPGGEEAHFRYTAGTKAQQRVNSGLSDYKNLPDTFELTQINGRPAFRYMASYTWQGKAYREYFIRVLGDKMMVMFFTKALAEEMPVIRPDVDRMAATVQVP